MTQSHKEVWYNVKIVFMIGGVGTGERSAGVPLVGRGRGARRGKGIQGNHTETIKRLLSRQFPCIIRSMSIQEAVKVIRRCEAELKRVLQDAASRGDYDCLEQVTEWARQMSAIVQQTGEPPGGRASPPAQAVGAPVALPLGDSSPAPARRTASKGRRSKKAGYPRFEKLGGDLVKIAWSRKEKSEYRHKAPRAIVDLLVARLLELSPGGESVTTDVLFPLVEPNGGEVPSYQAYLCLAWMRHLKVVAQDGRSGYHVLDAMNLRATVAEGWKALRAPRTRRSR
jgi:hypothetical protein